MKTITDQVYALAEEQQALAMAQKRQLSPQDLLFASLLAVLELEQARRAEWEGDVETAIERLGCEWPPRPSDPSLT